MRSPGILLIDSDLFVLLAGAGLLSALLSALNLEESAARRLQPLPHMLRKGRLARRYPPGILERAGAWCSRIHAVETVPPADVLDQLNRVHSIDPGEAQLFAVAADRDLALLASGDRRSFEAVATAPGLELLRAELRGKLVCLEATLRLLHQEVGYTELVQALAAVREHHRTLRVLLSQGEQTPEETFRDGLESYLKDLALCAGDLLFQSE